MLDGQPGMDLALGKVRTGVPVLVFLPVAVGRPGWAGRGGGRGSKEISMPSLLLPPQGPARPVVLSSEWAVPASTAPSPLTPPTQVQAGFGRRRAAVLLTALPTLW